MFDEYSPQVEHERAEGVYRFLQGFKKKISQKKEPQGVLIKFYDVKECTPPNPAKGTNYKKFYFVITDHGADMATYCSNGSWWDKEHNHVQVLFWMPLPMDS